VAQQGPSVSAVFRLITSSNFVGCSTGHKGLITVFHFGPPCATIGSSLYDGQMVYDSLAEFWRGVELVLLKNSICDQLVDHRFKIYRKIFPRRHFAGVGELF
jgi:hypothetical protein